MIRQTRIMACMAGSTPTPYLSALTQKPNLPPADASNLFGCGEVRNWIRSRSCRQQQGHAICDGWLRSRLSSLLCCLNSQSGSRSCASPQNPQHGRRDERLDYGCYEQEWGFSLRVLDVLVNSEILYQVFKHRK
jgi:hypothetical protein